MGMQPQQQKVVTFFEEHQPSPVESSWFIQTGVVRLNFNMVGKHCSISTNEKHI